EGRQKIVRISPNLHRRANRRQIAIGKQIDRIRLKASTPRRERRRPRASTEHNQRLHEENLRDEADVGPYNSYGTRILPDQCIEGRMSSFGWRNRLTAVGRIWSSRSGDFVPSCPMTSLLDAMKRRPRPLTNLAREDRVVLFP